MEKNYTSITNEKTEKVLEYCAKRKSVSFFTLMVQNGLTYDVATTIVRSLIERGVLVEANDEDEYDVVPEESRVSLQEKRERRMCELADKLTHDEADDWAHVMKLRNREELTRFCNEGNGFVEKNGAVMLDEGVLRKEGDKYVFTLSYEEYVALYDAVVEAEIRKRERKAPDFFPFFTNEPFGKGTVTPFTANGNKKDEKSDGKNSVEETMNTVDKMLEDLDKVHKDLLDETADLFSDDNSDDDYPDPDDLDFDPDDFFDELDSVFDEDEYDDAIPNKPLDDCVKAQVEQKKKEEERHPILKKVEKLCSLKTDDSLTDKKPVKKDDIPKKAERAKTDEYADCAAEAKAIKKYLEDKGVECEFFVSKHARFSFRFDDGIFTRTVSGKFSPFGTLMLCDDAMSVSELQLDFAPEKARQMSEIAKKNDAMEIWQRTSGRTILCKKLTENFEEGTYEFYLFLMELTKLVVPE